MLPFYNRTYNIPGVVRRLVRFKNTNVYEPKTWYFKSGKSTYSIKGPFTQSQMREWFHAPDRDFCPTTLIGNNKNGPFHSLYDVFGDPKKAFVDTSSSIYKRNGRFACPCGKHIWIEVGASKPCT